MPTHVEMLRLFFMGAALLFTFVGAGLYLRGFFLYFRTFLWLRSPAQAELRRRYRSSAIAAVMGEPSLAQVRRHLTLGLLGLPLFVVGGIVFNALQSLR